MKYLALATDYDGTLATDGQVDASTLAALHRWKADGRQLILITGRRLDDFLNAFDHMDLFDMAVVENGAVLYFPADGTEKLLGAAPPPDFVEQLRDRIQRQATTAGNADELQPLSQKQNSPLVSTGRVIVATWTPYDTTVRTLMSEMDLQQWQIIMNKGAVMILPQGIDKVTGLKAALQELGILAEAVVGVGDAENDLTFLQMCGLSAAVSNALEEVRTTVDWVARSARGEGVSELIDYMLTEDKLSD